MHKIKPIVAWFRLIPMFILCLGLTTQAAASNDGPETVGYIDDRALKAGDDFDIEVSSYFSGSGLTYSVNRPTLGKVTTSLSGSTLTVSAGSSTGWTSKIIVTATDSGNRSISQHFNVYIYSSSPADVNLSVSKSSISEGASATSVTVTAAFESSWLFASDQEVSLTQKRAGGVGATWTSLSSITIPAGANSASASFTVSPQDDKYDTSDGKVSVSGSTTETGMDVKEAYITLADDDPTPVLDLSVSVSTISEAAGDTSVTVTARHTNASRFPADRTVKIGASVDVGNGVDRVVGATLSSSSIDLNFPKNAASATATFNVTPKDDKYDTNNGTVSVIGSLAGITVNDAADITLADNDLPPVLALSISVSTISEAAGDTSVTVTARHTNDSRFPADRTVKIKASVSGGVGATLSSPSFDLSFPKDAASATASFTITPEDNKYDNKNGTVTVSGSLAGITVNKAHDITLTDDDPTPVLDLSVSVSTISEAAGDTSVTVTARHKNDSRFPAARTVKISAKVSGDVGASVSTPVNLNFPKDAASATATFTITPEDNKYDDDDGTVTVSGTLAGITVNKASDITLTDNDDPPVLALSVSVSTISEAAGDTSVTVTARHKNATRFPAARTVKIKASVSGDVGATLSSSAFNLSFSKDAVSATASFTITPEDNKYDNDNGTVKVSGTLTGITVNDASDITLTDDDPPPVLALSVDTSTISEGAGGTSVTVTARHKNASRFPAARTVKITAKVSGDVSASVSTPVNLNFPKDAASATATFTVTPEDNKYDNKNGKVSVSGSLAGITVNDASDITLTDDDPTPVLALSVSKSTISEGAGTTTVTVTARHKNASRFPAARTVKISASVSGGVGATLSSSAFNLSFSKDAVSATATFTVTPEDDQYDTSDGMVSVSGSLAGITVTSTTIALEDDDTRGVNVSSTTLEVAENGGSGTYDVKLDTKPTATVTVRPASSDTLAVTVRPDSLTFTGSNWNTAQTVTLTGVNDDLDNAGNSRSATIGNTASGGDYGSESASVSVTVNDDDAQGVSLSSVPASLSENGGSGTYDVKLDTRPTATVTVRPASSDTLTVTVNPDSLTFTSSDWNTAQTVTLTGVNDDLDNAGGQRTATLSHTVSGGDYGSVIVADRTVKITDDDVPEVTITAVADTVSEGTSITFTLSVSPTPAGSLSVSVSVSGGTGFLSGPPTTSVTIPADSSSVVFSLATVDDTMDEADAIVTATIGSGTGYKVGTPSSAQAVVTDDDAKPMPPSPPSNVTVTPGHGKLTLGWTASSGATAYQIKHRIKDVAIPNPWPWVEVGDVTRYTISGLTNGTTYKVRLRAVNDTDSSTECFRN